MKEITLTQEGARRLAEEMGYGRLGAALQTAASGDFAPLNALATEVYGAVHGGRVEFRLERDGRPDCWIAIQAPGEPEAPLEALCGAKYAVASAAVSVALLNLRKAEPRILVRDRLQDLAAPELLVAALVKLVALGYLDQAIVAGCVEAAAEDDVTDDYDHRAA